MLEPNASPRDAGRIGPGFKIVQGFSGLLAARRLVSTRDDHDPLLDLGRGRRESSHFS
jgi:hypothetical protein